MPTSVSDTINLGASVVTIIGGIASAIAFVRKLLAPRPVAVPQTMVPQPGYSPAQQPGYPLAGYAPAQPQPGYPTPGYPQPQPGYPASPAGAPAAAPVATVMQRERRFPHPVILCFAAISILCAILYSVELLMQYVQTGSTNIPASNPLIVLNAVLIFGNLIASMVVIIGLLVLAFRLRAWGWVIYYAIGLVLNPLFIGIFSILWVTPAVFYALSDKRAAVSALKR